MVGVLWPQRLLGRDECSYTSPDIMNESSIRRGRAVVVLQRRLAVAFITMLSALCVLSGCTNREKSSSLPGARDPLTLIVGRPAGAISLDPGRITDNESVEVTDQIFETLLRYKPGTTEITSGLARYWEVSEDGKTWLFHLRKGVFFHDGMPLNADAVVFSLERQRDAAHPFHKNDNSGLQFLYWANTYRNIRSVEARNQYTVAIEIAEPYAPFAANLAMFPVAIVSPTAVREHGGDFYKHPVGTGPFRFEQWTEDSIVLVRNNQYWGDVPAMRKLIFRTIANGPQRMVALESNLIDMAYAIPPDELQYVKLHPQLAVHKMPADSVAYLAMNTSREPFGDVEVRRAVNMAINKNLVAKLAYQGLATSAGGPLPLSVWGASSTAKAYVYDPKQARRILREAEREGRFDSSKVYKFFVSYTARPYLPDPETVTRILKANLASVGVKTELFVQEFKEHTTSLRNGEHDLCLFGWVGDNGDPDNFLYELFVSANAKRGVARNVAFFKDSVLDELLIDAQRAMNIEERETIYGQAQDRIVKMAPWVPLAYAEIAIASNRTVSGIVTRPNAHVVYREVRRIGQ